MNRTSVFDYVNPTPRNIRIAAYILSTGDDLEHVVAAYLKACEYYVLKRKEYSEDMKTILTGYGLSAAEDDLPDTSVKYNSYVAEPVKKTDPPKRHYTIYGLFQQQSIRISKMGVDQMYRGWIRFFQYLSKEISDAVANYMTMENPTTGKNYTSLEDFVYEKKHPDPKGGKS